MKTNLFISQKNIAKLKTIGNINLNISFKSKFKTKLLIPILTAKLDSKNIFALRTRLPLILKNKLNSKKLKQSLILKKANTTVTAAEKL